jgi:hypothetical protein
VGVQEVRRDRSSTETVDEYTFFYGKGNVNHARKRIISAVKRVEFFNNRISYKILRGRWCDIIVLNIQAPVENKIGHMKDGFYKEIKRAFYKFHKYHMEILLGDFNAKLDREDIFKPTTGNECLREISNDDGIRVGNLLLLLLLLTANGFSPGGSGTTIRQQTKYKLTTIRQHTI